MGIHVACPSRVEEMSLPNGRETEGWSTEGGGYSWLFGFKIGLFHSPSLQLSNLPKASLMCFFIHQIKVYVSAIKTFFEEFFCSGSGLRVHREFSPHPEVLSGTAKRGTLALGHNAGPVPLPTAWRNQAHQSLSMLAGMEE